LAHAGATLYLDSDRFDPDRMLAATLTPTTWFPFGGGTERCLGAGFAMVEMRMVLGEILRRVELRTTTAGKSWSGRSGTSRPARSPPATFRNQW
jgi:cytochrome P450